jgi:GNAT superfamily N-acetyltransferase
MITFCQEDYFECIDEINLLLKSHWEEVGTDKDKIPMDVDFAYYADAARAGILHVMVARNEGELVGYHSTFVRPHVRYKSTLMGFVDVYFLHKDFRRGSTGIRLLRAAEQSLKARGVKKILTGTKLSLDRGKVFEHLGYHAAETTYTKWIGD